MSAMLSAGLFGAGHLGHATVVFQWRPVIARFDRVSVKSIVMIGGGGVWVGFRVEAYALILEPIVSGRANDAAMYHTPGIFSKDLESHGISDIGGDTDPPACFLFGRWEGLVRV